jgi:trk system potassium uptake protein
VIRRPSLPRHRRPLRNAIDLRAAFALVGRMLKYLSVAPLLPAAIALGYGEAVWPFLVTAAITAVVALGLERLGRGDAEVGVREGYLVVSVLWLLVAAMASLPYLLSGDPQLDRPVDAYFEAMSGFTTTGASILTDVEALDHSLAIWRQFSQWLGGMGIVVLALAVLPRLRVGGRQLLENEMPGPELGQLSDRIRDTARKLWLLYVALTAAMVVVLTVIGWVGLDDRMSPYEAVAHAFTTLPTGGFSTRVDGIGGFGAWSQWTVIVFMVIAGGNFALWYRTLVRGHWRAPLRDDEMRLYGAIVVAASALVAAELWSERLATGEGVARHAIFQVISTLTTTGFASTDVSRWSQLALMTLILLMFVGACAGSAAGSVKIVRHLLLAKVLRREIHQTIHPEEISPIRLNGVRVEERTVRAATVFILLYVGAFAIGAGLIAAEAAWRGPDIPALEAIAAAAAALGNVGPVLGLAGPGGSFAGYGDFSTIVMTGLMWLGRLEIIPIVVLLSRRYWRP